MLTKSDAEALQWFIAVFEGDWKSLPEGVVAPDVIRDSMEWAEILLYNQVNPYHEGRRRRQNMYLGLKMSPDKLITVIEAIDSPNNISITIIETLHHYILRLDCPISTNNVTVDEILDLIHQKYLPLLSKTAKQVVDAALLDIQQRNSNFVLGSQLLTLISHSDISISSIREWPDRVNIFWLKGDAYLDFYKTYSRMAAPIFRPGLDWDSNELRIKYAVSSR